MLRDKIYEIDSFKFRMKDPNDLTLDEDDKVQSFFKGFYAADKSTIAGSLTGDEMAELLPLILIPQSKLPEGFDYKKIKRGVATKVICDFFLNTIFSSADIVKSLKGSMLEHLKL